MGPRTDPSRVQSIKDIDVRFMKVCAVISFLVLATALTAQNSSPDAIQKLLPPDAKVIETADLSSVEGNPRVMVLWMVDPTKKFAGQEYCGTQVHGDHYWEGPGRLSLMDTGRHMLLNTIKILGRGPDGAPEDDLVLPAFVYNSYYFVPHPNTQKKGEPKLLNLQDLSGDGKPAEFVLFMYDACGLVSTSVWGYNQRSDRAVQYQVEVLREGEKPERAVWVQQIFARKPIRPGYLNFTWGRGHGLDDVVHEDVSFDPVRQVFVERQRITQP